MLANQMFQHNIKKSIFLPKGYHCRNQMHDLSIAYYSKANVYGLRSQFIHSNPTPF